MPSKRRTIKCESAAALMARIESKSHAIPWTGCWIWTASDFGGGRYGCISVGGAPHLAHRAAWVAYNGREIPVDMNVCHTCDIGLCVNPRHLFIGSQLENVRDMISKGRKRVGKSGRHTSHAKGSKNGSHKFSDELVTRLLNAHARGATTVASLARDTGISETHARRLINNEPRVCPAKDAR